MSALLALPQSLLDSPLGGLSVVLMACGLLALAARYALTVPTAELMRRRVHAHAAVGAQVAPGGQGALDGVRSRLESLSGDTRLAHGVQRLVDRTGRQLRPVDFLLLSGGCGLVLGFLAGVAFGAGAALVAVLAGAALPTIVAHVAAGRRASAFDEQLPAVLLTLAASLKVGHSFVRAMQAVADEGRGPAADEFARVLAEMRLGKPVEAALADLGTRIRSQNLDFVLTSVTIQREIGGSLAGLLETVSETVRERQQLARKLKALTAMGRASAVVLVALPFVAALGLTAVSPDYMTPLFTSSTGRTLIAVSLVMMGLGALILKRIVSTGR
jgi:tight adherence protein B